MNFHFHCILHRNFCKQNSVDTDQMPHTVASDQGLHCLHMSLKWVAILKKGLNIITFNTKT